MMTELRLERIETKLLSAEDQLDALNQLVWRQQEELDLLRAQLREVARQLGQLGSDAGVGGGSQAEAEIPPHW